LLFVSLDQTASVAGFGAAITVTSTGAGAFDTIPAQPERMIDASTGLASTTFPPARTLAASILIYTDEIPNESNDTTFSSVFGK